MRAVLVVAVLGAIALAATSCGGSHKAAPPRWVQRANAVCKVDNPKIYGGGAIFDSAATIAGLRREVNDLARAGFFKRVPAAGIDVAIAGGLLLHAGGGGDFGTLQKADRALIRARTAAARRDVHCSFAAVPLQNL